MRRNLVARAAAPVTLAVLSVTIAGCEATKSSNPLSPSVAGPIGGVEITAPKQVEPTASAKYKETQQPIRLVVENASTNGQRPITYSFEVATDSSFGTKLYARAGVPPGSGRTSVQVDRLDLGRAYYWRVRAEDGANSSPYSVSQFEVLPRAQLNPPGTVSPSGNERVTSRRPTLTLNNSDRNAAVGDVSYEFQVATDQAFTQIAAGATVGEGAGRSSYTLSGDLGTNLQHFWRARATDGETTSGWGATQTFLTPLAVATPSPSPSPTPSPVPGGTCALGNGPAIVACIAARYPDKRTPVGSLQQRQANMMFLRDRVIEAGKCSGQNYGYNLKRGGPEHSIDVIAWKRPDGNMGVDIAIDYDNLGATLQLSWGEVDLFASFDPYPNVSCSGV